MNNLFRNISRAGTGKPNTRELTLGRPDIGGNACTWEAWTPAKINLFLEILGRRADGYHELETVMTAVAIYDSLHFRVQSEPTIALHTTWTFGIRSKFQANPHVVGDIPSHATNIVTRALTLFRERAEVRLGATVQLRKRIPSAAGLGGASSDAAAALAVANLAWNVNWKPERLGALASELGSDVPFFLSGATAAVCRGRGEQITPLEWMWRPAVVLVRPPEGLSTPEVYRQLKPPSDPLDCQPLVRAICRGNQREWKNQLANRLQEPAGQLTPWLQRLKQEFSRRGALAHQMSGSGTCYFGLCRNFREAQRIANCLHAANIGHVIVATTTRAFPTIRWTRDGAKESNCGNHRSPDQTDGKQ